MPNINTIDDLIRAYYRTHPEGHYFDRETLKFYGERRSELRLLKNLADVCDAMGETHKCYVVSSLQRNAPYGPRRVYHYFDVDTLNDIIEFDPIN